MHIPGIEKEKPTAATPARSRSKWTTPLFFEAEETQNQKAVESLPFTIEAAMSDDDLKAVCRLRAAAYGHHLPEHVDLFAQADEADHTPDTTLLLAKDKDTREVLGTVRLQTNRHHALDLEQSVALPAGLAKHHLCEITRLAVLPGKNQLNVRAALWKACYLFSQANQIRAMVITARRALVRQYEMLGFVDVFRDKREIACSHVAGLPHRVLVFDVQTAEREWFRVGHDLHRYMVQTFHPDITILSNQVRLSCATAMPRQARQWVQ